MLRCDLFDIGTHPSGSNIYSTVYILILYNCHTTNCTSSQVPFGYLIRRDNTVYIFTKLKKLSREKINATLRIGSERERQRQRDSSGRANPDTEPTTTVHTDRQTVIIQNIPNFKSRSNMTMVTPAVAEATRNIAQKF